MTPCLGQSIYTGHVVNLSSHLVQRSRMLIDAGPECLGKKDLWFQSRWHKLPQVWLYGPLQREDIFGFVVFYSESTEEKTCTVAFG